MEFYHLEIRQEKYQCIKQMHLAKPKSSNVWPNLIAQYLIIWTHGLLSSKELR